MKKTVKKGKKVTKTKQKKTTKKKIAAPKKGTLPVTPRDVLGALLGSSGRVRITRLFLENEQEGFTRAEIIERTHIKEESFREECAPLFKAEIVRPVQCVRVRERGGKNVYIKESGWKLNPAFPYAAGLRALFGAASPSVKQTIMNALKKVGRIDLLVLSGVFMGSADLPTDILIVGDKLDRTALEKTFTAIQSETGRELRYVVMDHREFEYRKSVHDKFVRLTLERPHDRLIDRMVSSQ